MYNDELMHQVKLLVSQAVSEIRPWVYGHVASYDPQSHRVRLLLPALRDGHNNPSLSAWLPLGAAYAYNGTGIQWAPVAGATADQPTNGEQCMMLLNERGVGFAAVPCMFWNQSVQPPGVGVIQPGELLIQQKLKTKIYLKENGDVIIDSPSGNVTVTCGTANVTARTVVQLVAPAIEFCKSLSDTLYTLCTSVFYNWVTTHVHTDPQGGVTGVPTTTPPTASLTTVVTAE